MSSILGGILQASGALNPKLPRRNQAKEVGQYNAALPAVIFGQTAFNPSFEALQSKARDRTLFGSTAGTTTEYIPTYWARGKKGPRTLTIQPREVYDPGQRGLFSLLGQAVPELSRLRDAEDPEGTDFLSNLTDEAGYIMDDARDLMGRGTNPDDDRRDTQNIRAGQASRGLGYGMSDVLGELLGLDRNRDGRRMDRGRYAMDASRHGTGVLSARRGFRGDMLGDAMRLITGVNTTAGGGMNNPFNSYSADVNSSNFNAKSYEEIAKKNNIKAGLDSVASGTMSIMSMFSGGMGGGMGGGGGGGGAPANPGFSMGGGAPNGGSFSSYYGMKY